nr:uncharacterized protein LOC109180246 [Ipomoea batatas]
MDPERDNTEQTKFGALRSDSADLDGQAPRLATGLAKVDLLVGSAKADLPSRGRPSRMGSATLAKSNGDEVAGVEVHIGSETNPVGSDEDLNAPIEISSSFGCQDSSTTMADRRASHQACLKSRASIADKGKAPAFALVAPDPTLADLHPPAPLTIGAQMAHVELRGRLKPLIADSKSLKSIKTTHTKEIEGLNSKNAKLEVAVDIERKNAEGLARKKSLAREDALAEYKESEAFREELMVQVRLRLKECQSQHLGWSGSYPVPTLTEVGQGDAIVLKEEDQSAALHLNHCRSRRSDHTPPTGPTKDEEVEVPPANA